MDVIFLLVGLAALVAIMLPGFDIE